MYVIYFLSLNCCRLELLCAESWYKCKMQMIYSDKLNTIYSNSTNKYEFCIRLLQVIKIFEVADDS